MTTDSNILIFKTNIQHPDDIEKIAPELAHDAIETWNVDITDVDCVLRVVSSAHTENDIIEIVTSLGYHCEELE